MLLPATDASVRDTHDVLPFNQCGADNRMENIVYGQMSLAITDKNCIMFASFECVHEARLCVCEPLHLLYEQKTNTKMILSLLSRHCCNKKG